MLNSQFLTKLQLSEMGFKAVGQNVSIHASAVLIGCDRMNIASNVRIDPFCIISAGENISIGRNVHIAGHCTIVGAAPIEVGDFAGISHGSKILSASDDFSNGFLSGPTVPDEFKNIIAEKVRIGRHSVLGANCVILPGVNLGDGVAVGAQSLVRDSIDPWLVIAGSPARIIGQRPKDDVISLEARYLQASSD